MSGSAFNRRHVVHMLGCVLTAVVSVGAAAVVFSVINALYFTTPAVAEPHRIAVIVRRSQQDGSRFDPAGIQRLRELGVFDGVAGQLMTRDYASDLMPHVWLAQLGRELETLGVTDDYFGVLGLKLIGPGFSADDGLPGAPMAGILSYRVWQNVFKADPAVIGSTIETRPVAVRIAGIAPRGFNGALRGERVDLWLPYSQVPRVSARGTLAGPRVQMPMVNFCRLLPGASLATSKAAYLAVHQSPWTDIDLVSLNDLFGAPDLPMVVMNHGDIVYLIGGVVVLLLAVGCATLTALLMVHYEQRRQELAVRMAIGARPADLIRQVGLELATVVAAAVVGVIAVVSASAKILPQFVLPDGVDFSRLDFTPDLTVIVVAAGACVTLTAASAALPLLGLLRANVITSLAANAQTTRMGRSLRLHRAILGVHAALTVLSVIVAGLFVRSAVNALRDGPGFDDDQTLFVTVNMRPAGPETPESEIYRRVAASHDLIAAIRARTGVEAVALGAPPLGPRSTSRLASTSVVDADGVSYDMQVGVLPASPGYLEALGVELVAGRPPRWDDVVVSSTLAAHAWPEVSPLDGLFKWGPISGRVAGVVNMGYGSIRLGRPRMFLTFDLEQRLALSLQSRPLQVVVRADNPDKVRQEIRQLSANAFPDAVSISIISGRELVQTDLGQERLGASFLSVIGAAAWLLGLGSLFGLVGYVVERRRRDFGIMSALGASRRRLIWLAAREGLEPAVVGGIAGAAGAAALARTFDAYLLGIAGTDMATYAFAIILFALVATLASVIPASRIRHGRPLEVLRRD